MVNVTFHGVRGSAPVLADALGPPWFRSAVGLGVGEVLSAYEGPTVCVGES